MSKQPLLILCCCFIAGILFREYISLSNKVIQLLVISGMLTAVTIISRSIQILKFRKYCIALFCFSLGITLHHFNLKQPELPLVPQSGNVLFKFSKKLNSNEKHRRYEVEIASDSIFFGSVLTIPRELPELNHGHYYRAKLYINRMEEPPHDYQFNYAKYLSRKNIYYQSYLPDTYAIAKREDLSFGETIKQKRLEILHKIDSAAMTPRTREFLKGLILADRTEIDRNTIEAFTRTGLVHILAISGSHIAIIFGLMYWVLTNIFPASQRKWAISGSLILIWLFAIFIDYGNSVVRSCIMITIYYIYVLLQRKSDMMHSMALAASIIIFADTHQIFDVGFQLSFVAVFGIFWLNQPILKHLPRHDSFWKKIFANTFSITMAAQIATLPLVLHNFNQFSPVSVLANLIVVPVSNILIIFSVFMTVIISLGLNLSLLFFVYDHFIRIVLDLIHLLSGFDHFMMYNVPLSLVEIIIMAVGIYHLRFLLKKPELRNFIRLGIVVVLFIATDFVLDEYHRKQNEVIVHHLFRERYFSVKEQDKITFWIPQSSNQERIRKYIINPYLTSRRAKTYTVKILPPDTKTVRYQGKTYILDYEN